MRITGAKAVYLYIGAVLAMLSFFVFNPLIVKATNPTTMNFQGKVVNADGTNVANGTYTFVFKLYTVSSAGSAIWTETDSLTVTNGVFQVDLGANCPFFSSNACNGNTPIDFGVSSTLYLGMTFNGDAQGEMTPRVKIQSVPYAFNSDKVGGKTADQLVQLSPGAQQTGNINISGSGTFASGMTVTGAAVNLNGSSNFDTNINTGTSTGAVNIGNSAAGIVAVQSAAAINFTANSASTWSTGSNTLTLTSSNFNISSLGVVTLAGGQSTDITTTSASTASAIKIKPGTSSGASSNGAAVTVSAGDGSGTTAVTGGTLTLSGGNATGASGTRNGGNVVVDAGTGATANGSVSIGTANASSVTISRSGITTTIAGLASVSEGLTVTGTTSINGSGTSNTTIGNSSGGTITIGASSGSDLALNDAQWSVSGSGNAAFNQISAPTYTSSAGLTINSGNNTLTFDSSDTTLSATGLTTINLGSGPTISSSSGNITLSGAFTGVSAAMFVLPIKTDAGDPTTSQTNGGIYYNSNSGKFRCYEASTWKNCISTGGTGGGTLQDAYDGSTSPEILLNTTNNGLTIRNAASDAISGNLLEIQNNAGTATFLGVSSSEVRLQDSGGNVAFLFDSATSELRVYADGASPTAYARIYYSGGEAVFAASTGTTRVGAGSGNISMSLTNASDVLTFTKSATLAAGYSSSDFSITRNLTIGSNAATGNVLKVEDLSSFSGGSSASNLLYINQSNTSATGNLILAQLGGASNDKFKVNVQGTVTIAAGQSYTGAGALTVAAGASSALTLTSPTAATWSTTTGNLTLQAGGANAVILKPGTNSTSSLQVQNASGTSMLAFDSTNNRLTVGVSDTTGTLLILDTKTDTGDPTGVNGAMYYNSNTGKFRCYEASAWKNCISAATSKFIVKGTTESVNASTTLQDDDELQFTMGAGETWIFEVRALVTNSNSAGPDWKSAILASTATSCNVTLSGSEPAGAAFPQVTTTDCTTPGATVNATIVADTDSYNVAMQGRVTDNGSGGTVKFQWAQNTSTAVNLQVRAGSYLLAQKVGGN